MARVYKFAQKEYGINSEYLTFFGHDNTTFTYNGQPVMGQGGVATVVAGAPAAANANGLAVTTVGTTATIQTAPADATHPGVVTSGTQTFGGDKTFNGALTVLGDCHLSQVGNRIFLNADTIEMQHIPVPTSNALMMAYDLTLGVVMSEIAFVNDTTGIVTFDGDVKLNSGRTMTITDLPSSSPTAATNTNVVFTNGATGLITSAKVANFNGQATIIGQACTTTQTIIGFNAMTPSNHQLATFSTATNKLTVNQAGSYVFQLKLGFTTEARWKAILNAGPSGGAATQLNEDSGYTNPSSLGAAVQVASLNYFKADTTATDIWFTIAAEVPGGGATSLDVSPAGAFFMTFTSLVDF